MNRYTFNPPEDELINYYLNNKITENDDPEGKQINEVNICHHEPADLPGLAKIESGHTWYFISPVEKFGKLNRRKRASKTGHWKITGNSCTIKDTDGNPIGLKKFLVFQENKNRRSSTLLPTTVQQHKFTWIIHEFHSFLHHPNKMLTHHKDPVEDYGGDYCNDLEELTQSWEQGESNGLLRRENGHVYGQNIMENSNVSDTTLRKKIAFLFYWYRKMK
ncbi:NAC domain-containing protein 69 [Brassica rapa]|uniref:NAC domain-containing protein 69 n=1 Tax=Brassica campestris TaxID=3711 RepID=UPI00142E22D0|nr:NAC domain-containing protein 69 [Brassica rapa]